MFSKYAVINRYRYENEKDDNKHSPLNDLKLKGLLQYRGKNAIFDLLMNDGELTVSKYASLYLTKDKPGFEINEDNSIEWIIDEDKLRFDFLGIKILKGTLQRQKCYEQTNSYIRFRVIHQGIEIYKKNSNLIRHTTLGKKHSLKIATCCLERPGDHNILTIQFNKHQPYYSKELQLSNGQQTIAPYRFECVFPLLKTIFDLSEMRNCSTEMCLKNPLFGKSVKVILPNLKKVSKKSSETCEERALASAGFPNETDWVPGTMEVNSMAIDCGEDHQFSVKDCDKIFVTPSIDQFPMEEISVNDVEQIFHGSPNKMDYFLGTMEENSIEIVNGEDRQFSVEDYDEIFGTPSIDPIEEINANNNEQIFADILDSRDDVANDIVRTESSDSGIQIKEIYIKKSFIQEDLTSIDEEFDSHFNSFKSNF